MNRALSYLQTLRRLRRHETVTPRFLTYTVTFNCNARCSMCDSWRKPPKDDLELSEIDRIFGQLPPMDAVRLTGGEPFVRKDMTEIADLVQSRLQPRSLHISTNGFLTERIVRFCEDRPKDVPLSLLVSIDGVGSKHNAVRGNDRAWDFAVRTLCALAPRRKELRLKLAVNQTVVDAESAEQYSQLRDFLRPLGVHNYVVMAYEGSGIYDVSDQVDVSPTDAGEFSTFGRFTPAQLEELLSNVGADMKRYPFWEQAAKRYYIHGIRNRLERKKASPNPRCVALNAHLRILPNGKVPTCQFNTQTVGSFRDQDFKGLWFSQEAVEQREWVRRCPGCWAECEVLPSAIYGGDLLRFALNLPLRDGSEAPRREDGTAESARRLA